MKCPECEFENRPQAKFCEECAAPLGRTCANCGNQLSATAKFCPECAHPVARSPAAQPRFTSPENYTPKHLAEKILNTKSAMAGERKQVTVLFADMKGSMELLADRDLWQRQGKKTETTQLLAEVYGWFTEGFDTADLRNAKALLQELS